MSKIIEDITRMIFIVSIFILELIALSGVWELIADVDEIMAKVGSTVLLLVIAGSVVLIATKVLDSDGKNNTNVGGPMNPTV